MVINKKRGFIFISLLIILISATSQATIYVNDIRCSETGYLSFTVEYGCRKDKCPEYPKKNFSEIDMIAVSDDREYSLEFENPPEFVYQKGHSLMSKEGILNESNQYRLIVDDGEEKKEYQFECPNVKFLCEKIDLEIDLCMKYKLDFYYLFHGLGNQFSQAELENDLDYYINPSNKYLGSVALVSDDIGKGPIRSEEINGSFKVRNIGYDLYLLNVPANYLKNKEMNSIYIEVKDCDKSEYNTAALKKCEEQKCYSDEDCPVGSYCNRGRCNILLCQDCEIAEEHACVSNCGQKNICEENACENNSCKQVIKKDCCLGNDWCDDGQACTKDECVNNLCVHKGTECGESADPCVIGICKEPDGCEYIRKGECENKWGTSRVISGITGAVIGNASVSPTETVSLFILILLLITGLVFVFILNSGLNKGIKKGK